jgi:hypothetical protein
MRPLPKPLWQRLLDGPREHGQGRKISWQSTDRQAVVQENQFGPYCLLSASEVLV